MAKAPPAKVTKTSGSGVSRLSYHRAYNLRRSDAPKVKADSVESDAPGGSRYAKSKPGKTKKAGGINVSYGDTIHPSTLEDIVALGKRRRK